MLVSQSCLSKIFASVCLSFVALLPAYAAEALLAPPGPGPGAADGIYVMTPLVSDGTVAAPFTDTNLKNPWGIAFHPNAFVWVANNGTATSTLYDGAGKPQTLVVTVPGVGASPGVPTGIVYNGSTGFVVTKNAGGPASRSGTRTSDGRPTQACATPSVS